MYKKEELIPTIDYTLGVLKNDEKFFPIFRSVSSDNFVRHLIILLKNCKGEIADTEVLLDYANKNIKELESEISRLKYIYLQQDID